jgi:SNF2 family DNA or RNA helicase
LADEMGLGKTVMLLGLIHSNNPDIKARREKLATLVKSRALMKK